MTIESYTDLKNSVGRWLSRRTDLVDVIPDFIALGESRMFGELRLQRMQVTDTLTVTGGNPLVPLPDGWLEFAAIQADGPGRPLEPRSRAQLLGMYSTSQTGAPSVYTIDAESLVLGPTPDTDYTLNVVYYVSLDPLSDRVSSNWLLERHPGLYLWAALAEAAPFISADPRIAIWEGKYEAEKQRVIVEDERARWSGGGIRQVVR